MTQLISDLSGDEIAEGQGKTVEFSYDGKSYSIDLTSKEAAGFEKSMAMYLEHATRVGGRRTSTSAAGTGRDYDPKAVRAWAQQHNVDVPRRGRIPAEVLEQYKSRN